MQVVRKKIGASRHIRDGYWPKAAGKAARNARRTRVCAPRAASCRRATWWSTCSANGSTLGQRRERQAVGLAQEERSAERLLERAQAAPDGRVLVRQRARRARQRARTRRGEKEPQVVPIQPGCP
jgi:hypothetical protein